MKLTFNRAEKRREQVANAKALQYEASGFKAVEFVVNTHENRNKYMPHIGAKQRAKGAKNISQPMKD